MEKNGLTGLQAEISSLRALRPVGRVAAVLGNTIRISGLSAIARLGDRVRIQTRTGAELTGEVLQMEASLIVILPDRAAEGLALGDRALLLDASEIAPSQSWIGRVIDPFGAPLDGRPLLRGAVPRALRADPPAPARRRALGRRLETGMAAFNTVLPVVRGQRLGLFAGSGVGKSMLLGHLARHMQADVVVIALIGERGRELRDFVENVLGPEGLARAVIVTATSDRSPMVRRRCAWTAMAVAEFFRDQGLHVLFLADSITRFAEAHREVATAAGEMPALRGFPASTAHMIMSLCERAGPGEGDAGDITAILTVLVAGSDMEEPVADILRGVLDGHVVLDRQIAERGRYPAIDLLRSVSRSLPNAASQTENHLIVSARRLLASYARSETMIRAGLYTEGSDPELDQAIKVWAELDGFLALPETVSAQNSFARLGVILRRAGIAVPAAVPASGRVVDHPGVPGTGSAGRSLIGN
ncbi:flagellum-specific ATP synthase [Roseovarius azorensis]|uniref:Flagellum-specific ATP synthase n=1 Tax=Roseovarius azorensis TaxID=1287727 RepID=A0A1H7R1C8_9RHOB|nr:FliI/YscN family ATPase [Roseovarius azorensis]SEL54101.1 flagellum-specific ATP synthase [Roseovarius azorensis]